MGFPRKCHHCQLEYEREQPTSGIYQWSQFIHQPWCTLKTRQHFTRTCLKHGQSTQRTYASLVGDCSTRVGNNHTYKDTIEKFGKGKSRGPEKDKQKRIDGKGKNSNGELLLNGCTQCVPSIINISSTSQKKATSYGSTEDPNTVTCSTTPLPTRPGCLKSCQKRPWGVQNAQPTTTWCACNLDSSWFLQD